MLGTVSVTWQDSHGSFRVLPARGVDICETGAQIEVMEAVDRGNSVMVRADRYKLSTSAAVRYCRRQGPKYRVGLEFTGGYRWRPAVPQLVD